MKRDAAYQAAEAGVDDYISKLIDDRLYYVHFVHAAEATRRAATSGRIVTATQTWQHDRRQRLDLSERQGSLVRFGEDGQWLRVQPPDPVAVRGPAARSHDRCRPARPVNDGHPRLARAPGARPPSSCPTSRCSRRQHQLRIRRARPTGRSTRASTAAASSTTSTTTGSRTATSTPRATYRRRDADRTARRGTTRRGHPHGHRNPINFASFLASLVDIQAVGSRRASTSTTRPPPGWWLTFSNNGTFTAQTCTKSGAVEHRQTVQPVCTAP